jgi:hypothetical protein
MKPDPITVRLVTTLSAAAIVALLLSMLLVLPGPDLRPERARRPFLQLDEPPDSPPPGAGPSQKSP